MNINRACHSVFYGRLKTYFPEWAILYTTRPGLGLAKPCKSRLFSLLTVHSRPPFPFIFCFLPPVNFGGAAGAVFSPVGFLDEHAAADCTAFQVPIPVNLCFQRPGKGQDRPPKPFTADRERNHLRARCRCLHRQGQCSCRPHSYSTPAVAVLPERISGVGTLPTASGQLVPK